MPQPAPLVDVKPIPATLSPNPSPSLESPLPVSQPGPHSPSVADDSLAMIHPRSVPIVNPPRRFANPFTLDGGTRLPELRNPRFARPENGQVNGYVKFHWPTRRDSAQLPISEGSPITPSCQYSSANGPINNASIDNGPIINGITYTLPNNNRPHTSSITPSSSNNVAEEIISSSVLSTNAGQTPNTRAFLASPPSYSDPTWASGASGVPSLLPLSPPEPSLPFVVPGEPPQMMPPHFGYQAKMDARDRRLWDFCAFDPNSLFLNCALARLSRSFPRPASTRCSSSNALPYRH